MVLLTLFTVLILEVVHGNRARARAGRGFLDITDHFIIIGHSPKAVGITQQLILSQTKGAGCTIVVLHNHPTLENVEVEARFLRSVGPRGHNL